MIKYMKVLIWNYILLMINNSDRVREIFLWCHFVVYSKDNSWMIKMRKICVNPCCLLT